MWKDEKTYEITSTKSVDAELPPKFDFSWFDKNSYQGLAVQARNTLMAFFTLQGKKFSPDLLKWEEAPVAVDPASGSRTYKLTVTVL